MEFRSLPRRKAALWMTILSVALAFTLAGLGAVILAPVTGFDTSKKLALVVGELLLILPVLLYVRSHSYSYRETFRLKPVPGNVLAASALIAVSALPIADELDRLFFSITPYKNIIEQFSLRAEAALRIDSAGSFLAILFGAVIFAAVTEEALFRGFLQKSIESSGASPLKAVLISSLVFSVVHFSPQILLIFLLGVLLGYMALRTDSLYPVVIIHLLNNAVAILMINLKPRTEGEYFSGDYLSPLLLIFSAVVFAIAIRYFHRNTAATLTEKTEDGIHEKLEGRTSYGTESL